MLGFNIIWVAVLADFSVRVLALVFFAVCLAACNSGGGDSDSATSPPPPGSPPPPPPAPPTNSTPTISGSPATTVVEGNAYAFMPVANDADGDPLTFEIENPPPWASFDTVTGALSGTPDGTHIGTTTGVLITVTDGTDAASLPVFDLEVRAITRETATVTWDVPQTNADGSALEDLAGFTVHYGSASENYSESVTINDAAADSAAIGDLTPGTWYFAVTAFDDDGNHSAFSAEVSKQVLQQ